MEIKNLFQIAGIILAFSFGEVKAQTIGWTKIYKTDKTLYSVFCINYDTVFAVGKNGLILKTTDQGQNWATITSHTLNDLNQVCFVSKTTGYAIGANGTILKTNDLGNSWSNIGIKTNLSLFSISFINQDTGWISGGYGSKLFPYGRVPDKGILIKTTDGGTNWIVDSSYNKTVTSICFIGYDTGYACFNTLSDITYNRHALLCKTNNGGKTFSTIFQDTLSAKYGFRDIRFLYPFTLFFVFSGVSDNERGVYKSTDLGLDWERILEQWSINSLSLIGNCSYYISYIDMGGAGSYGRDSCNQVYIDSPGTFFFDETSFITEEKGYGVGGNSMEGGYICKKGIMAIDNVPEFLKLNIDVSPNPFNDKITVKTSDNVGYNPIVVIYNSCGQIVYSDRITCNPQTIDLKDYNSGLYLIKIFDDQNLVKSFKIIKN